MKERITFLAILKMPMPKKHTKSSRFATITVLITGAGAPGAPGIIKSLRENGERRIFIIGVDADPEAAGRFMVDRFYTVPPAGKSDFTKKLLNIAVKEKVNVVLPLVTRELLPLAKSKDKFIKHGIKVIVSDEAVLAIANDKGKMLTVLKDKMIPVPDFRIITRPSQIRSAARELGYPDKKICIKPCVSNGSRGFRIIDENLNTKDLFFNYKPNHTYVKLRELLDVLGKGEFPPLVLMECLPGDEFSVDLVADNGKPIYIIPRRRLKIKEGISVSCQMDKNPAVIDYCRQVVTALGLFGNNGIQVKLDVRGRPLILEINPRVQGTIVHCTAGGVNLPYIGIKLALGEDISGQRVSWGLKMSRVWEEIYWQPGKKNAFLISPKNFLAKR